jgi:hypothetical protein
VNFFAHGLAGKDGAEVNLEGNMVSLEEER